jgi:hypothetical protein
MRNFTFIITILFLSLTASGQQSENLQLKIEKMQEKFEFIYEKNKLFQNHNKEHFSINGPKSAAVTEKLYSTVTRILNVSNNTFENDTKESFFYDAQMRSNLWKNYEWDFDDDKWELEGETELEYNNQGQISSMIFSFIDEITGIMTPETKMEAIYNGDGTLNELVNFSYEEGVLVSSGKQEYSYNAQGNLIRVDMLSVEEDDEETMKYIITYNASDQVESQSMYFIDGDEEILFYQSFFTYDGSGKLTKIVDWGLSFTSFTIEMEYQTEYQYNAAGDVSEELLSVWVGGVWIEDSKDEYFYKDTNFSEISFPSYIPMFQIGDGTSQSFNKAITEIKTYDSVDGSYVHTETTTFYYSDVTSSGIETFEGNLISLYPNPAEKTVTFWWENSYESLNLEIYQISGSRVKEIKTFSGKPVSIAGLHSGVYYFKLNNEKQTIYSGKLIKK